MSVLGAAAIIASLVAAGVADAATITVGSDTIAASGDAGRICVGLSLDAGDEIAGTENELTWDSACASILPQSCVANPGARQGSLGFSSAA